MGEKRERVDIELMRIAACMFVMVDHSLSYCLPGRASKTWFAMTLCFVVSKTAVPLFLMITGALLLGKCDNTKKWGRRLVRPFCALVIGSLGYGAVFAWIRGEPFNIWEALGYIFQENVSNGYWYLYLYLGILLLLPVLQRLVQTLPAGWLMWLIALHVGVVGVVSLIPVLFPDIRAYGLGAANVMFTSYLSLFSPYLGMVLLGYAVERYVQITKRLVLIAGVGFAVLMGLQVWIEYLLFLEGQWMYHPANLPVPLSALCLYLLTRYAFRDRPLPAWFRRTALSLGSLTFGVYLLSDMAVMLTWEPVFVPLIEYIHPLLAWLLWIVFMFLLCAGVVAAAKGTWALIRGQLKGHAS